MSENGDDVVYVPRVVHYNDDEPLGVEGDVVTVLSSARSTRRITVLVAEPAELHEDVSEAPEGIDIPGIDFRSASVAEVIEEMDYRDLQSVAGDLGIKANQSSEKLAEAVIEELD